MNAYTQNYAPQQTGMNNEAAQMAPQQSNYAQQLGAALSRPPAASQSGMPDMQSLMAMMQQFQNMRGAQQPPTLAPVYDHSFPTTPGAQ